jgi:hypothetical protein
MMVVLKLSQQPADDEILVNLSIQFRERKFHALASIWDAAKMYSPSRGSYITSKRRKLEPKKSS